MVARPSYLYNGNTYTEKITSWSWNSPRVSVNEEIRHLVISYTLKLQNLDFNFFFDHVKFSQNYIRILPVNTYSFIDQGNDHVSILGTCKSAEKCWSDQLFSTQCGSVLWLRETSGWFHVKVFALWTTTKQKIYIFMQGCQPVRNFRILYGFYMQNTGVRIWPSKYGNWALSVLSLKVLLPEQSLPVLGSKSVKICGILCLKTFKYLFNHQKFILLSSTCTSNTCSSSLPVPVIPKESTRVSTGSQWVPPE